MAICRNLELVNHPAILSKGSTITTMQFIDDGYETTAVKLTEQLDRVDKPTTEIVFDFDKEDAVLMIAFLKATFKL